MADPTGQTAYRHERRGLLISEERTNGDGSRQTSKFGYDANGNRTLVKYPTGRTVTTTFDFADRPASAFSPTQVFVSSATYLPLDR
jgi:YD repeat-containing protein